jgi:hypothetical protein
MKQTAVEWLKLQLETYGDPQYCGLTWKELDELCEQAKEMEKKQIYRACAYYFLEDGKLTPTQYCNETFKSE